MERKLRQFDWTVLSEHVSFKQKKKRKKRKKKKKGVEAMRTFSPLLFIFNFIYLFFFQKNFTIFSSFHLFLILSSVGIETLRKHLPRNANPSQTRPARAPRACASRATRSSAEMLVIQRPWCSSSARQMLPR